VSKAEARLKECEGSRARERAEREALAEALRHAQEATESTRAELVAARAEEANLRVALAVAEAAVHTLSAVS